MTNAPIPLSDDDLEQVSGGVAIGARQTDMLHGEGGVHQGAPSPNPTGDINAMMGSLAAMMQGSMQSQNVDALLITIAQKMRETEAGSSHKIETDQENKKASLDEKQAKMDEAMHKIEDAQNKGGGNQMIGNSQGAGAKGDAATDHQMVAVQQMLDGQIDAAMQRLMQSGDKFSTILDQITEATRDRGNTLAQSKFRG